MIHATSLSRQIYDSFAKPRRLNDKHSISPSGIHAVQKRVTESSGDKITARGFTNDHQLRLRQIIDRIEVAVEGRNRHFDAFPVVALVIDEAYS